jgi:hypothetical protein
MRKGTLSNLTTAECKASGFSGIRYNGFTECYEFWMVGDCKREVPKSLGREGLAKAYEDQFGFAPNTISVED